MENNLQLLYGIKNLRSIDLTETELRPITVLVGRNNSGKSTFLRSIPLLRQSINQEEFGPISWLGNKVDFGDFTTAVKRGCEKEGIVFLFGIRNLSLENYWLNFLVRRFGIEFDTSKVKFDKANVSVLFRQNSQHSFRSETQIQIPEHKINLKILSDANGEVKQIKLNNKLVSKNSPHFSCDFEQNKLFSEIILETVDGTKYFRNHSPFSLLEEFLHLLANLLPQNVDNKIERQKVYVEISRILNNVKIDSKTLSKLEDKTNSKKFKEFYRDLQKNKPEIQNKLNEICGLTWAITAHNQICKIFNSIVSSSIYFPPTRGRDERYFRIQPIDRMEISPEGDNLSGFYDSLGENQINEFSNWIKKLFGFGLEIKKTQGHVEIFISEGDLSINLADSGYGISGILPFLTQIWWEFHQSKDTKKKKGKTKVFETTNSKVPKLITIEEPELHLHPAFQAKIADIIVDIVKQKESNGGVKPIFVVETHSEYLISRLSELITEKQINPNDVQVKIFSKEVGKSTYSTKIETKFFDESGYFIEWPYGFFGY